jgi:uncharacterized protein DUF6398
MSGSDIFASNDDRSAPLAFREGVAAIAAVTDLVCAEHLDTSTPRPPERSLFASPSRAPAPLERGDPRIWAAGVIYTVGSINFLFDKSQPPHLRADKLAEHVGVVQSTMVNKSARIRSLLRLSWYEPELTRCERVERNPFGA